ncbi:UNVERIFIED_CONTAM: hypothetical protein Scaly_0607400 [Sesamum calycinum]|uniref:RNase H type-1 domain-containing protein n=1 Tax=Sesamum calycinum TaxID=2727403 RepID=A0AAW2RUT0_9LAMI
MQRMIYEASRKAIVEYERRTITPGMRDMKSQLFTRREIDAEMGNEVPGEPEKDREQELSDEALSRRVAPRPPGFSKVEVDDTDPINAKLFVTTLIGKAQEWFTNLSSGSIESFGQLIQKFAFYFASRRKVKRSTTYLFAIRQREDESLKSFMGRFNNETLEVQDLWIDMVVSILMHGLTKGPFASALARDPPEDVEELMRGPTGGKKYVHIIRYHQNEQVLNIEHQEEITFGEKDRCPQVRSQNDPMVIKMYVANYLVHKVLVDNDSSIDIIFSSVLKKMDLGELKLRPVNTPLVGFSGSEVLSEGTIDLPVSIGKEPIRRTCMIQFLVVDSPFAYNVVSGRLGLNMIQAIVSTYHLKMKFPKKGGIREVRCNQKEATRCYNLSLKDTKMEGTRDKRKVDEPGGENGELKNMKPKRIEPVESHKEIELQIGATYQRLVNKILKNFIEGIMEVYVDDMLVKSKKAEEHMKHLESAFAIMRTYGMKLNTTKCMFGVRGGKFLGYMISEKGIEANPEKIEAIVEVAQDVQRGAEANRKDCLLKPLHCEINKQKFAFLQGVEEGSTVRRFHSRNCRRAQQINEGWLLHVNGSSNTNNGGAGIHLQGPGDIEIEIAVKSTNNETEYEALLIGLQAAREGGVRNLDVYTDSQLVAMQIEGSYETRE